MKKVPSFLSGLLVFIITIVLLSPNAFPQERCKQWAGKIVSIQGTVQVRMAGETAGQALRKAAELVGPGTRAQGGSFLDYRN